MPENKLEDDLLVQKTRDLYVGICAAFEQNQAAMRDALLRVHEEQAAIHEVYSRANVQVKQEYAMLGAALELQPVVVEAKLPAFMLSPEGRVDFDYIDRRLVRSGVCSMREVGCKPFSEIVEWFRIWEKTPPDHELAATSNELVARNNELAARNHELLVSTHELYVKISERLGIASTVGDATTGDNAAPETLRGLAKSHGAAKRAKQGAGGTKPHPARDEFLSPYLVRRTRNAIADKSGVAPSSLQRWHQGKSKLSPDNRILLANYLNVPAEKIPND